MRRIPLLAVAAVAVSALVGCSTGTATTGGSATTAPATTSTVSVIVPADPGGGWDATGRSMSNAFTSQKILSSAPVTNVPGAGGTVGLTKLASEKDPWTLMVMGLVMVGAVETNKATVRIEDTTPIARLTEEPLVVVVPASSKYKTLKDLLTDIKTNGQAVSVTGGSAGGADHIFAGLLLQKAGLQGSAIASKLNYVPNSGGSEAATLILGNNAAAAISGVGEFVQYIESGEMRALAVSAKDTVAKLPNVPTATKAGYDVVLTNWRGVVAPKSVSASQKTALSALVEKMHASSAWQAELKTRGWTDAYLTASEFQPFLKTEVTNVSTTLKNIGLVS